MKEWRPETTGGSTWEGLKDWAAKEHSEARNAGEVHSSLGSWPHS